VASGQVGGAVLDPHELMLAQVEGWILGVG
jgi:hypothetical protein